MKIIFEFDTELTVERDRFHGEGKEIEHLGMEEERRAKIHMQALDMYSFLFDLDQILRKTINYDIYEEDESKVEELVKLADAKVELAEEISRMLRSSGLNLELWG